MIEAINKYAETIVRFLCDVFDLGDSEYIRLSSPSWFPFCFWVTILEPARRRGWRKVMPWRLRLRIAGRVRSWVWSRCTICDKPFGWMELSRENNLQHFMSGSICHYECPEITPERKMLNTMRVAYRKAPELAVACAEKYWPAETARQQDLKMAQLDPEDFDPMPSVATAALWKEYWNAAEAFKQATGLAWVAAVDGFPIPTSDVKLAFTLDLITEMRDIFKHLVTDEIRKYMELAESSGWSAA